ncbi:FtsX-like permease family protein [Plantactinospora soyae]|uniref:ABC transport system permease protein n=1 Tax=Plantactinospora soyae TaxID=1544732 RepID=A0A927M4Q0_9ACTN|nr:ABC transporter permease [Plantactinospora soyae]MBE1484420.1 putative ABC transport system permease protein [Plantactinospora soyae]
MWKIGSASVRARLGAFVGAWLALTLGVALVAACGLLLAATSRADAGAQAEQLASALAMLAMIAVFASVFVVGSTFSYVVAQRWREFALLRLGGASTWQVRASVLMEAAVVGVAGSLTGCMIGVGGGQALAWAALRHGLVDERLVVRVSVAPLVLAVTLGVAVTLIGANAAARRASRVRPIEALRTASYEQPTMTGGRWIWAALLLFGAFATIHWTPVTEPEDGVSAAVLATFLLIGAGTALSPVLVPPLVWTLAAPTRLGGATGLLARRNTGGAVRRTASTAAPVLVTMALTVGVVGAATTGDVAQMQRLRQETGYEHVVLPNGVPGLTPAVVGALGGVPGARVTAPLPTTALVGDPDSGLLTDPLGAAGVDPDLREVLRLRPVAGTLDDLDDTQTVAVGQDAAEARGWRVGGHIEVGLEDGVVIRPRIVAIVADPASPADLLLPRDLVAALAPVPLAPAAYITLDVGAEPAGTLDALRQAAGASGRLQASDQWLADRERALDHRRQLGLLFLLGLPMLYTGIAVANTLIMATRHRAREFALTRLVGATRARVIGMVAVEALLTVGVGAVLAACVVTVTLMAVSRAVGTAPVVPWAVAGAVVAGCLALALAATVVPTHLLLRRERPIQLVVGRE